MKKENSKFLKPKVTIKEDIEYSYQEKGDVVTANARYDYVSRI
jgi:hypothetical protein